MPIFRWALAVGVSVDKGVVGGGNRGDEERTLTAASDGRSESGEGFCIIEEQGFFIRLPSEEWRVGPPPASF